MTVTIKKMPNAQKWTEELVSEHLQAIGRDAYNSDTVYLGRALVNRGLYPHVWRYWKQIFRDHDNIIEAMMQIEAHFEAKLFEGAVRKELSPWIAIFGLKYNHHWTDMPVPEEEHKTSNPMLIQLSEKLIIVDESDLGGTYKKIEDQHKKKALDS